MLIRRLARPMLAAQFITENVKATLHPEANNLGLERVVSVAYTRVTGREPSEQTATNIARGTAIAGVVGGTMLAVGLLPRVGAVVVGAISISRFIGRNNLANKSMSERKDILLESSAELGAIGGILLAVVDTAGKPSLVNRARQAGKDVRVQATSAKNEAKLQAALAKSEAKAFAKQAKVEARQVARNLGRDAAQQANRARHAVQQFSAGAA